jgi:hypothetical protein
LLTGIVQNYLTLKLNYSLEIFSMRIDINLHSCLAKASQASQEYEN